MAMARFLNLRCRFHFGVGVCNRNAASSFRADRADENPTVPAAPSGADLLRSSHGGLVALAFRNHAIPLCAQFQEGLCLNIQTRQIAIDDCLADHAPCRLGAEIIFIVEAMHHLQNIFRRQSWIFHVGQLMAFFIDHGAVVDDEAVALGEVVKLRSRICMGNGNLNRFHVERLGEIDGVANGFLGFAGKARE